MSIIYAPIESFRTRLLDRVCRRLTANAHKVRKLLKTSFSDFDLSVEELVQHGALKVVEFYEWMIANKPEVYLPLPEEDLERILVAHAAERMSWHVIDVYRKRDLHSDAVAPAELLAEIDDTGVLRVALWRRIAPLMGSITPRQRAIVQALWDGLDTGEVRGKLGLTVDVIQKDLAAVRSLAA